MVSKLGLPLALAGLALAVSDPANQKVTNGDAFNNGAGNNDKSNIYDDIGNARSDEYSKKPCPMVFLSRSRLIRSRLLLWRLATIS